MVDSDPASENPEEENPGEEETADTFVHTPVLWDSALPSARANVAKEFAKIPLEDQRKHAETFFDFLLEEPDERDLHQLNEDANPPVCALISLPKSKVVKVIYIPKFGSSGILGHSPLDNKLLTLLGDGGNEMGTPRQVILPLSVMKKKKVKSMTQEEFSDKITAAGDTYSHPLTTITSLRDRDPVELMQIAPIPAYLVYDLFQDSGDTAEILERVLGSSHIDESPMLQHVKTFLLACLSGIDARVEKPYLEFTEYLRCVDPPPEARAWATKVFKAYFPDLVDPPSILLEDCVEFSLSLLCIASR